MLNGNVDDLLDFEIKGSHLTLLLKRGFTSQKVH